MGFNIEFVRHKGVDMEIWDVEIGDKIRPLLVHHYKGNVMDGIVYIVDSTDRELFPSVRHGGVRGSCQRQPPRACQQN